MPIRRRERWNPVGNANPTPEPRSTAHPAPETAKFRISRDREIPNAGAMELAGPAPGRRWKGIGKALEVVTEALGGVVEAMELAGPAPETMVLHV